MHITAFNAVAYLPNAAILSSDFNTADPIPAFRKWAASNDAIWAYLLHNDSGNIVDSFGKQDSHDGEPNTAVSQGTRSTIFFQFNDNSASIAALTLPCSIRLHIRAIRIAYPHKGPHAEVRLAYRSNAAAKRDHANLAAALKARSDNFQLITLP